MCRACQTKLATCDCQSNCPSANLKVKTYQSELLHMNTMSTHMNMQMNVSVCGEGARWEEIAIKANMAACLQLHLLLEYSTCRCPVSIEKQVTQISAYMVDMLHWISINIA